MNISFRYFLLKHKASSDGRLPVYLRLTKGQRRKLISAGILLNENQWDQARQRVKKNHPMQRVLNVQLEELLIRSRSTMLELPKDQRGLNIIKQEIVGDGSSSFFGFGREMANELLKEGKFHPSKKTITALNHLRDHLKSDTATFEDITLEVLNSFRSYLIRQKKHPNTISKNFERLKQVFKKANALGKTKNDPFRYFEPIKRVRTQKTRLNPTQIKAISEQPTKPGSWEQLSKDAFLFSFYNAGIRFGDLATLKWKHIVDGRLKYEMGKTSHWKNIRLLPQALSILDRYRLDEPNPEAFIFPILDKGKRYDNESFLKQQISSKNALVNRGIKALAKKAGIQENVTFHVARHSFADFARTSGMNIYDISKALGHTDIKITQSYLKSFDETSLDAEMERLFNG